MSAPPPGVSPASRQPSTTPNNGQGTIRRKKPTGPFAPKPSRAQAKRPPAPPPQKLTGATKPLAATNAAAQLQSEPEDDPSTYHEIPIRATKKSILEGMRFHAMKFISNNTINPYDGTSFVRPVKLHRRFPKDTPNTPVTDDPELAKEREKEAIRKADRAAEREATQAQIAPTDKAAAAKKRQPFKKKTEDVYYPTDTPEAQKRARLRYEEGRPWHFEDFENKNIWVGTYEEPLSESNVMFLFQDDGSFKMVPIEKWYRFNQTGRFKLIPLQEAEDIMNKRTSNPRWFLDNDRSREQKRAELARQERLTKGRVGMRGENRVKNEDDGENENEDVADDVDELDFEAEDEFQDDDEGKLFGEDEDEAKEAASKLKKDRHNANIFAGTGVKDEKDWEKEEMEEEKREKEEKIKARKLRRKLVKIEKNYEYDDDESENEFSEPEGLDESDVERERAENEHKKDEELKANGDKAASQMSTNANTPSGRAEKHSGGIQAKGSMSNLKRPGSPNLSETSGSESINHKRMKKQHRRDMSGATSPMGRLAGSGSDTETERRARPMTLNPRSNPGSPGNATPIGSRAGSPVPMPTIEEIKASIPAEGISIPELIKKFREQVPKTKEGNKAFIGLVLSVARALPGNLVGLR
ncbi:Rap30/74 interaction domain-containing protein [Aureobasidium subglaciale]|nr:Rap30/74 interaction domain-containing protein [Aureobasidium subglaciale]KAI5271988.1 Rap30/74 interaction domain-containing protein [Aureobasidium subglaciale]